jgi:autotransporter-associated beta strand protein
VANGQLSVPSVVMLQSGTGNADFASYVGGATGSLQFNTSTRATSLATSPGATVMGDIGSASTIGTASVNDTFNVLSLRTNSNINGTDATDILQINNGGLIFNGTATPPTIGGSQAFTLRFGTGGLTSNQVEALVFVRGGQTGSSTLTANFQSADFTKFGQGSLLINGVGNTMTPVNSTAPVLRNLVVNEGTLAFSASTALPNITTVSLTGVSTTSGSASVTVGSTAGLTPGMLVTGPGIPIGATVAAVTSSTAFTLSVNANATSSSDLSAGGTSGLLTTGLSNVSGVNLVVNDSGTFNLNGQNLAFAGLGSAAVTGNTNTGTISNTGANATLTLAGHNQTTTFQGAINDGAGTIALVKSGTGVLQLTGNSAYSGGTTINAGTLVSSVVLGNQTGAAAFANMATGAVGTVDYQGLGTGGITLAGGTLQINNLRQSEHEDADGIANAFNFGPAATDGYNITVNATNNFGSSNTTSKIHYTNSTTWAAINSLTINAPALTFDGSTDNGLFVRNNVTLAGDTTLNVTRNTGFGGKVAGTGSSVVTKLGQNTLFLTNSDAGANANTGIGTWNLFQGTMEVRMSDGTTSNPLVNGSTVVINGSSTFRIFHEGNNMPHLQSIKTFQSNNLQFGSTAAVSSTGFIASGNVDQLNLNRWSLNSSADNKSIWFNNVSVGGALVSPIVYFNGGNAYSAWVNGTTTGVKDISFVNDAISVTLNGAINLPGTFLRYGSQPLYVNADSSSTHTGGTWLHSNTLFFGTNEGQSYVNQTFYPSTTAKIGGGNIFVQAGAAIQFNAATNVASGQITDIRGNLTNYGMLRLASDTALSSFNIRSGTAYGPQPVLSANGVGQSFTRANNIGAGVLSLGSTYTQAIDLAKLGDGTWFLGSATNGIGQQGSYNSSSLGVGLGNAYRLGAGGNILNIGSDLVNSNVLTDTNVIGVSSRLIIGTPAIQNANVGNGTGTVMIHTNQNYTGSTLINRTSTLDVRGTLASTVFENYGTFVLSDQGTMVNAGNTANTATTVLLRPGSELRFDNANGGLPPAAITHGRWFDTTGMTLDNASLRLTGSLTSDITENVGALTVTGGAGIVVQRGVQGRYGQVNFSSLVQTTNNTVNGTTINGNNGTLALQTLAGNPNGSAANFGTGMQLGGDERISVTGGVTLTNGIAPVWIWNGANTRLVGNADSNIAAAEAGGASFVTYGNAGFVSAGWTAVTGGTGAATAIAGPTAAGPTDRFFINSTNNTANTTTITGNLDVYALRVDSVRGDQIRTVVGAGSETITIRSGGLISSGGEQVIIRPNTLFGPTGTDIAYIHVANSMRSDSAVETSTLQFGDASASASLGQIFASHIVKDGNGILIISNPQTTSNFAGNLIVNAGTLQLTSVAASGNEFVGGNGGSIVLNGQGSQLTLTSGSTSTVTFQNNLLIGENNPLALVVSNTGTSGANAIGNLTFGGITNANATPESREQGQTLLVTGSGTTSLGFQVAGTTNLGPAGNVFFNTGSNITLAGTVSGSGTMVRTTAGNTLFLNNTATLNTWTGGTLLLGGTTEVRASAPNVGQGALSSINVGGFGTGAVTILGGTLNLRVDGGNDADRERVVISNAFDVRSSMTIDVNRHTAGTNKDIRLSNFTIGSQILTVNAGSNSYNLELGAAAGANSGLFLTGTPTINNTMDTVLFGVQDGSNGSNSVGNYILKNGGTGTLWVGDATSTFTGGIVNNETTAAIRFGDNVSVSTTAQAGTGTLRINNGARLRAQAATNFATGQTVLASSVPLLLSRITLVVGTNFTVNGSNSFDFINGASYGFLGLESNFAGQLNMANVGAGRMWLAADQAGASYTNNALGAGLPTQYDSSSTAAIYRLGAGQQVLTLAPTTATSNVLTGTGTKVYVGNFSTNAHVGSVRFNNTNDYTGGTVILPILVTGTNPNTLFIQTGTTNTPLGTGQVDVFGNLVADTASGSFINAAGTGNQNVIVTHPGGVLRFDNGTNNNNRWFDSTALTLDGATFSVTGPNNATTTETLGQLDFGRGSRIALASTGTGQVAETFASLGTRTNSGTLTFLNGGAGRLGIAPANNSERVVITSGAPSNVTGTNMLPGYFIAGTDGRFVTHGANGFTTVADGSMVSVSTADFNAATLVGTSIANVNAAVNATLSYDTSVFALRLSTATGLSSGAGLINTLTFAEQGAGNDMGGIILTGSNAAIGANLKFGSGATAREALIYVGDSGNAAFPLAAPTVRTLTITGDIVQASQVTKFGPGTLAISKDQYNAAQTTAASFNWVVNEGILQLNTFGASGTGAITLNGSGYGASAVTTQLNLRAQNNNVTNAAYTMSAINTVDNVIIDWDSGIADATNTIGAINVTNTGTASGVENDVPARLRFNFTNNRLRNYLNTGVITLNGTTAIDVNWGSGTTNGTNSGVIAAGLSGAGNLVKWGPGYLFVRGDNTGFTGNTFIEQGAVSMLHNNALGSGTVTVRKYGILDIGVSDVTKTATYETGGIERWSIDGARDGLATLNLNGGTLQINADITNANQATMTVNLTAGGGIEGWVTNSDPASNNNNVTGVFRTVGSNVAFNLTGGVTVGQNLVDGVNGLDNGRSPTSNTINLFTGVNQQYHGVILELKGNISGTGSLTKQGYDIVTLSGANTYTGGTTVFQGVLRTGAVNALGGAGGNTGDVVTRGEGVLDLFGFNQTIRHLSSPVSTLANSSALVNSMGFVTNTAYDTATLTVGNSSTGSMVYGGVIQNNVALTLNTSAAGHVLSLRNANTYVGGTTVTQGWLEAANTTGSATGTGLVRVNGGNLAGAGFITGRTILNGGGTIQPGAVTAGPVSSGGVLSLGGLTINGGSLVFGLTTPGSTTDDMIQITGADTTGLTKALQLDGALSGLTINDLGGFTTGTYNLINYNNANSTLGGSFATTFGTVLNPTSPNPAYFLTVVNNTVGKTIDLLVQSNTTALWTGAEDQKWNLFTQTAPKNWKDLGGTSSDFANGLDVTFDNTATGFLPAIDGVVKPLSVVFNNTTTYTLSQANGAGDKISNNLINSQTGDTDSTTNVITNVASTTGYTVGMTINGAGIPANSVITAVGANTITINQNTTSANTGTTLTGTTVPSLTKNGTGIAVLNTPDNDFTGGSTLNAGTLRLGASTTVTAGSLISGPLGTGTVTLNGGTLEDDGSTRNVANSVILGGNVTFSSTGSGSVIFTNEVTTPAASTTTITNPSANTTLTVNNNTEFQQVISGSGKAITKAGSGTLTFTAVNTYNGGTTVNAGTLTVTSTGGLASGSNLTVGASGTTNFAQLSQTLGTLSNSGITTLNGAAAQSLTAPTLTGSGDLNLGSNVGTTLTAANGTYSGTIDQTGFLVKNGSGADTLTLTSGASTYTAGTMLNAGTLGLGASSTVSGGVITQGPIGSGTLTVAAGTTVNGATAAQTLHNNVALNGNVTFGGTNLTFSDAGLTTPSQITLGANLTTTVNTGVTVNFNQVVNDGASTFALTKAGGGALILTKADNTYSGVTTVSGGILEVTSLETQTGTAGTNADSLGDSSNAASNLIIGTATLQYIGSGSTTDRLFDITASATATVDASGTGALVFNNTGPLGTTAVRNLVLTGSNTADNTLAAVLNLGATGTLTKNGAGTWFLTNAASTYAGATTINAGVLKVNLMANGGANSSIGASTNAATNFVIGNGATFSYVGSTTSVTDHLITLGNQSAGRAAIFDSSGTGVVQFTNTGAMAGTGTADNSRTVEFTGTSGTVTTPNQFSLIIQNRGTGFTNVIKSGTGVWSLVNAVSTFGNSVSIQNGTLIVNNVQNEGVASNLGTGSNATGAAGLLIGSATTNATLRFVGSGGTNNSTNRIFTLGAAGGTIDASGAAGTPLLLTGTTAVTMGAATTTPRTLTLTGANGNDNTLTPIVPNGTGAGLTSLAKTGDGTWVLSGVNTYTGTTTISDGTLKSGVNNTINSGSAIVVSATNASDSATWNLQTFNQTSSSASMAITMGGNTSSTSTITGTGTSTLTLGGNVTYDATNNPGTATISVPTLALGTAARTFTVGNSTNAAADMTVTSVISGGTGGAIVKDGAGTLVLNNASNSTYTGTTTVNGGTLQVGVTGVGTTGTGAVTVASTGTLAGTGTVLSTAVSTVQSGGFLTPGDSSGSTVGTLTFSNSLTLASGSSTTLQITTANNLSSGDLATVAGLLAAGTYSGIVAAIGSLAAYDVTPAAGANDFLKGNNGTFSATSGSTITIADLNYLSSTPTIGHIFNLIDWGTLNFSGFNSGTNYRQGGTGGGDLDLPTLSGEFGWDVSAFNTHGILVVVPEPSRMLLLMFGLLGLFFRRRRRNGL